MGRSCLTLCSSTTRSWRIPVTSWNPCFFFNLGTWPMSSRVSTTNLWVSTCVGILILRCRSRFRCAGCRNQWGTNHGFKPHLPLCQKHTNRDTAGTSPMCIIARNGYGMVCITLFLVYFGRFCTLWSVEFPNSESYSLNVVCHFATSLKNKNKQLPPMGISLILQGLSYVFHGKLPYLSHSIRHFLSSLDTQRPECTTLNNQQRILPFDPR